MSPSPTIPQGLSASLLSTSRTMRPSSPMAEIRGEEKITKSNLFPSSPAKPRGFSDSRLKDISPSLLSRTSFSAVVQSESPVLMATLVHSSSSTNGFNDVLRSPFKERSPTLTRKTEWAGAGATPADVPALPSGNTWFWWSGNRKEVRARPWNDADGDSRAVPDEQKESWEKTRGIVSQAVACILGTAAVVAHATLVTSIPLLQLVPVPGLAAAAKLLLHIWDAVQEVDTNRLAFLRLTERCACIVITLHQELQNAGLGVEQELSGSMRRIEELFSAIQTLVRKEGNVPFLKRYLKREETLSYINSLNRQLDQELQILGPSFQIRTVKLIKEFAAGMDERIEAAIQRVLHNNHCSSPIIYNQIHRSSPRTPSRLPPSFTQGQPLTEITSAQDDKDRHLDCHDLWRRVDATLQSGSDSDMLELLQIPREDILEAIKSMQRHLEQRGRKSHDASVVVSHELEDNLDHEFVESGIDSLRRMSKSSTSLPSWTITRFEVDCGARIGAGFFSDVYEGTWRGRAVAVKVLRDFTSSYLFVREVEIWKNLTHPNVIMLFGASSASGNPPWFFVSPFAKYGDLGSYLRRLSARKQRGLGIVTSLSSVSEIGLETSRGESLQLSRESDKNRFMLEIAMGMDYLHNQGVLHGDLKCANVLLNESYTCMVSDFGQSEIRAETYRMSGMLSPGGTLRWQAPEAMEGQSSLTPAIDVYAYAISCIEVLTMGQMPWNLMSDDTVQFIVLREDGRPAIPPNYCRTPIEVLLQSCWARDPILRPPFSEVVRHIGDSTGGGAESPISMAVPSLPELDPLHKPMSPSLSPRADPRSRTFFAVRTTSDMSPDPRVPHVSPQGGPTTESASYFQAPVLKQLRYAPLTIASDGSTASEEFAELDTDTDTKAGEAKNEYRYRTLLSHRYHSSLSLALWQPVQVEIGAVGYLLKPSGSFVTLFNAINPSNSLNSRIRDLPSIAGYGNVSTGTHRHSTRNAALRGFDAVVGFLSSGKRDEALANRRASFPLRIGHKVAYMYTESTEYHYLHKVEGAKMWFKANADRILDIYGSEHKIDKEGLMLVVGVLQAPSYALFVSHRHSDGNVHFHALTSKQGKPWGAFTIDTDTSDDYGGPFYHEPSRKPVQCAWKVSVNGDPPKAMLLARLRFPPDLSEPTTQ